MESIEKLRTSARNMAKGRNLANHEECNLLLIIADEIEAEIESRYMPRPCDMDGVPVKIGDELSHDGFARNFIVHSYELTDGAWSVWDVANGATHLCQACRHVNPRTIEDVLIDAMQFGFSSHAGDDVMDKAREFADEIRELMEVDR